MMFHDDSRLPTIVYHLGIGMIKPHSFDVELGKAFRHPTKNTHLSKVTSSLFGRNANRHFIWLAFFLSISTKLYLPQNSASPSFSSHCVIHTYTSSWKWASTGIKNANTEISTEENAMLIHLCEKKRLLLSLELFEQKRTAHIRQPCTKSNPTLKFNKL